MMLEVGFLIPNSRMLPKFGRKFRAAFEMGMGDMLEFINISVEAAGLGSSTYSIRKDLEKLILNAQPDLIVAPLNPLGLYDIEPLMQAEETPLLAVTLGESRLPQNIDSTYIRINSYRLWECAWLTAYLSVQQHGSRVTLASDFHDCGYGLNEAAALGAQAAGGEIVNNIVTREKSASNNAAARRRAQSLSDLFETQSDVVILNYSGSGVAYVNNFLMELETSPPPTSLPYFAVLPLVVDESYGYERCKYFDKAYSYVAHDPLAIQLAEFERSFLAKFRQAPHPYMVMAYKSGFELAQLLRSNAGLRSKEPVDNLFSADLSLYARSKQPTQFCKRRFESQANVNQRGVQNHSVELLDAPSLCYQQCNQEMSEDQIQGWTNIYLIA